MLRIVITNKQERKQLEHEDGPIELGRGPKREVPRCVINDAYVSVNQLRVEEVSEGQVRIQNLSRKKPVTVSDGTNIVPGRSHEAALPVRLSVGETLIDLDVAVAIERGSLHTIDLPVSATRFPERLLSLTETSASPSQERLAQWFESVVSVQRAAAGSAEFYGQTARALVNLVGLDSGLVLLRSGDSWEVVGRYPARENQAAEFSRSILKHVVQERRTFYQPLGTEIMTKSLSHVTAVVASPIVDPDGESVIGTVYGSRFQNPTGGSIEIRPLEAHFVQVLASAVGAGLARQQSEAEAMRQHTQFELFFSPELARHLDRDPTMLEGREREVTILFTDIRSFSRISQKIGPRETFRLASDVMVRLTAQVRKHHGIVVDYVGDGLLAMWNAPGDNADHAALACRAALGMLAELPQLNVSWHDISGIPIALGVGINTGLALVGNTGSLERVKYGPLGHTVNLASRVEGATKKLGVPVLITGSTYEKGGSTFATRRLASVRVVGIAGAVDLYELHDETSTPEWQSRRETYEQALSLYESGRWQDVPRAIYPLLAGQAGRYDLPSITLLGRAIECIKSAPDPFDPVLELSGK